MEIRVQALPVSLTVPSLSGAKLNTKTIKAVLNAVPLPPLDMALNVQPLSMGVSEYGVRSQETPYEGEYIFTPTQDTQTVPIGGYVATQNITINPIPSNYGLITWNGATLTVS